jgi:hypothetical protein
MTAYIQRNIKPIVGDFDMLNFNLPAVKDWTFGEVEVLENNNRFVPVTCGTNNINLCLNNVLSPFGISNYDVQKTRKGLVLQLEQRWESPLECMTECLMFEIAKQSKKILGVEVSEETIRGMYKDILRKKEKFPICMVAKLTTTGGNRTRFWDMKRLRGECPEDFTRLILNVKVHVKGLYITHDSSISLIANITDCQMVTNETSCPF